jgi:SAM-dependent methyltransferase
LHPRPGPETLERFYRELYTPENLVLMRKIGESPFESALQRSRLRGIQKCLSRPLHRVLDLGAGLGFFLARLAKNFPEAEVCGVELSPQAASEARKISGVEVRCEALDRVRAEPSGLVCMNHVLEHLDDPRAALLHAYSLLSPGGLLEIEVPRLEGWGRRLLGRWSWIHLPPQHLHLFTAQGLARLLSETGFSEPLHSHTHSYPFTLCTGLVHVVRFTVGSRSRRRTQWWWRIPAVALAFVLLPLAALVDLLGAPLLDRAGRGDILTLVVERSAGEPNEVIE